jgi:predicted transcriptional regulator
MKDTKKTDPISVRLDPDVKAALEQLAAADERSMSAYIGRVLKNHVDAQQRPTRKK